MKEEEENDEPDERTYEDIRGSEYYLKDADDRYLHRLELGTFLEPTYAECNDCPFAPKNGGNCEVYMEDADCAIERTFYDVLIQSIAEQGIDDMDRLIIYPLAQQLIRLRRLYALENEIDLQRIYIENTDTGRNYTAELWEKILQLIDRNEKGYMQKLKELLATRKERSKGNKAKRSEDSLQALFENFDLMD